MRDTVLAHPVLVSVAAGVLFGLFLFAVPGGMNSDPISLSLNAFLAAVFAWSVHRSITARRARSG